MYNPYQSYLDALQVRNETKHKVFLSYYHYDDEYWRNLFEQKFGDIFINKSVIDGEINTDNSHEYVKRLIQTEHLSDTTVLVVLCGQNTWKRKHVDWEISGAISTKVNGRSGLVGILLPTHPDYNKGQFFDYNLPPRLADNAKAGFAQIYDWSAERNVVEAMIEKAFNDRNKFQPDNNRSQFVNNRQ